MAGNSIVRLIDVDKTYSVGCIEIKALQSVDLIIPPGGFVSILGPYGSGRTTLLNVIGCTCRPTAGHAVICGTDTTRASEESLSRLRTRSIGFISQAYNLIPDLTVYENLELSLPLSGKVPSESKIGGMLGDVELRGKEEALPGGLSSLESRLLAMAKSMVGDPQLLVCDDPTAGLSREDGGRIVQLLGAFNEKNGTTVIIGTADRGTARKTRSEITISSGRVKEG